MRVRTWPPWWTLLSVTTSFLFVNGVVDALSPSILPEDSTNLVRLAASSISKAFLNDDRTGQNDGDSGVNMEPSSASATTREGQQAATPATTKINHQIVRLPLTDTMYGDKEEGFVADRAVGWKGGPQETIRYLRPIVKDVLQKIKISQTGGGGLMSKQQQSTSTSSSSTVQLDGGLPPRVTEQVLLEYDGSSLMTAESPMGALYDVQALLQPNTDIGYYLDSIMETIEEQFSDTPGKPKRLFVVFNPAWSKDRNDTSGSFGFFEQRRAKERILDRYTVTFAVDQFIIRGRRICLVKAWPDDWTMYDMSTPSTGRTRATTTPTCLGCFVDRPTYQQMDDLLLASIRKYGT